MVKLRKLHIEDYKMFKDFDISFVDEDDKPLDIIVLAGVNGSGKTTLLEFINQFFNILYPEEYQYILEIEDNTKILKCNNYNIETIHNRLNRIEEKKLPYSDNIIYFSTNTSLLEIKNLLPKYIENMVYVDGIAPFDSYKKVTKYINEILKDLDITIEFNSRDGEGNLFFKNITKQEKFSIDELSTGEKTLLSKVLYLYLQDYKDKIILIDEPELSLHPSWQNKVLKIYENFALKNSCQIIIATHSPHIIGSAKNEYLRFLQKDKKGNIEVINNITAYGRDIEWILEQMGVKDTRLPNITKRFEEIQELINNQELDKADEALDKLEYVIGENDKDILALRNDLAFERIDFEEDN